MYENNQDNMKYHYNGYNRQEIPSEEKQYAEPSDSYPYYKATPTFSPLSSLPPVQDIPQRKKDRKALKIASIALGIILLSGGAGGGAAMAVLNSYNPVNERANISTTDSSSLSADVSPLQQNNASSGDITMVVQKAQSSVVEIVTKISTFSNPFMMRGTTGGAGSGVIISQDGYILTNNHVIDEVSEITVRTHDGTEYPAILVGTDAKTDLAVIKVDAHNLTAAEFANSDQIQVGELAVAIGNPLGELGGTVTSGIISATGREISIGGESMHLLQTSAAVNPGNSGGGLFNKNGELVGIINAKSTGLDVEGLGFAIPSNTAKRVSDDIIENGYVKGRPQFGIQVVEVADAQTAMMYRVQELGAYVANGGNTALKPGDRILSIDGEEIKTSKDISNFLSQHNVGDNVVVTVDREGQETDIPVTLTEIVPESVMEKQSAI